MYTVIIQISNNFKVQLDLYDPFSVEQAGFEAIICSYFSWFIDTGLEVLMFSSTKQKNANGQISVFRSNVTRHS